MGAWPLTRTAARCPAPEQAASYKRDTPGKIPRLSHVQGLTAAMPHPAWKGPREPVQLKLPKADKDLLAARAQAVGLSYSEYVMAMLRHEAVDDTGRPTWASASSAEGELPLAM